MKKQLLLALLMGVFSNVFSYNFYVVNRGDFPIKAKLWVKGVAWNWDREFTLAPNQYCQFANTLLYCGNYATINDARGNLDAWDPRLGEQRIDIPWQTSCHRFQVITVTTPTTPVKTREDALAAKEGIVTHSGFALNYYATVDEGQVGGKLSGTTRVG